MEDMLFCPVKFAVRIGGSICEENISEERVFEILESFYSPEFEDFEIEVWRDGHWETIIYIKYGRDH